MKYLEMGLVERWFGITAVNMSSRSRPWTWAAEKTFVRMVFWDRGTENSSNTIAFWNIAALCKIQIWAGLAVLRICKVCSNQMPVGAKGGDSGSASVEAANKGVKVIGDNAVLHIDDKRGSGRSIRLPENVAAHL